MSFTCGWVFIYVVQTSSKMMGGGEQSIFNVLIYKMLVAYTIQISSPFELSLSTLNKHHPLQEMLIEVSLMLTISTEMNSFR